MARRRDRVGTDWPRTPATGESRGGSSTCPSKQGQLRGPGLLSVPVARFPGYGRVYSLYIFQIYRDESLEAPAATQETSMISMLPEKLD